MPKVFQVDHFYGTEEDQELVDRYKIIGIYSSEEEANKAIERASKLPGFKEHVDGFGIGVYVLDFDYWSDGFVTVDG